MNVEAGKKLGTISFCWHAGGQTCKLFCVKNLAKTNKTININFKNIELFNAYKWSDWV